MCVSLQPAKIRISIFIFTGILAAISLLFVMFSIFLSLQTLPLPQNTPNDRAFDLPAQIPLEEGNPLPGADSALEQSDARKDIIEKEPSASGSTSGPAGTSNNYWQYPVTILPCTRSGDDLLVLVNKSFQLSAEYSPSDLVPVENSGIRTTKSSLSIRSIIVTSLTELANAAQAQSVDLAVLSAYRSYSTQQSTYSYWVSYNGGSVDAADRVSARPGHSQHQLGTAIDFTTSEISDQLGQQFANTAAGQWLAAHAWEYGFAIAYSAGAEELTGYSYEPWHFRYIGKENALEWHGSGKPLELWLRAW